MSFFIIRLNVGLYRIYITTRSISPDNAPNAVPIVPPAAPYAAVSTEFLYALVSKYAARILTTAFIICSTSCETAVGIIVPWP